MWSVEEFGIRQHLKRKGKKEAIWKIKYEEGARVMKNGMFYCMEEFLHVNRRMLLTSYLMIKCALEMGAFAVSISISIFNHPDIKIAGFYSHIKYGIRFLLNFYFQSGNDTWVL